MRANVDPGFHPRPKPTPGSPGWEAQQKAKKPPVGGSNVKPAHQHSWKYLRQEEQNVGYDRNPTWHIFDVFFCEGCLEYQRKHIRTEEPSRELYSSGKRLVMWSAQA